jgi:membrane protein YqaA with SNARE-associated domain
MQALQFMHGLAARIQAFAEALGGPGLLLVAFFDSSFITLPEVADFLVVFFTIREPDRWLYFASLTTVGSLAGCYALFLIARKGGEALLRRRLKESHIERGLEWFKRHGVFVLIVPAMLPPPVPFKIFVLLAGVAGLSTRRFLCAVAIGRGLRYGGEALLARWYGERALAFITENASGIFTPAAGALIVAIAAWWLWQWWQRRRIGAGRAA